MVFILCFIFFVDFLLIFSGVLSWAKARKQFYFFSPRPKGRGNSKGRGISEGLGNSEEC